MKNATDRVNKIKASGRIVSESKLKNGWDGITLFVKLDNREIYPKFYCPKGVLPDHDKHERLLIYGHVHTYIHRTPEGKKSYRQQFVADKIVPEKTLTEMSFGEHGSFYPPMYANVFLKGAVHSVKIDNGWMRLSVTVNDGERDANITTSMKMRRDQPAINAGDPICLVCGVSTSRKEVNGKSVTFEDVTISDIAVLNKEVMPENDGNEDEAEDSVDDEETNDDNAEDNEDDEDGEADE